MSVEGKGRTHRAEWRRLLWLWLSRPPSPALAVPARAACASADGGKYEVVWQLQWRRIEGCSRRVALWDQGCRTQTLNL